MILYLLWTRLAAVFRRTTRADRPLALGPYRTAGAVEPKIDPNCPGCAALLVAGVPAAEVSAAHYPCRSKAPSPPPSPKLPPPPIEVFD